MTTKPQDPTDQDETGRTGNFPYSEKAKEYVSKAFPCEPPCDSLGVCSNCTEELCFGSGYNFGYHAGQASPETMSRFLHETRMAESEKSLRRHYEKMFAAHNDEHDKELAAEKLKSQKLAETLEIIAALGHHEDSSCAVWEAKEALRAYASTTEGEKL